MATLKEQNLKTWLERGLVLFASAVTFSQIKGSESAVDQSVNQNAFLGTAEMNFPESSMEMHLTGEKAEAVGKLFFGTDQIPQKFSDCAVRVDKNSAGHSVSVTCLDSQNPHVQYTFAATMSDLPNDGKQAVLQYADVTSSARSTISTDFAVEILPELLAQKLRALTQLSGLTGNKIGDEAVAIFDDLGKIMKV